MNYRHAFHAGNFGDVLKHAVLVRVIGHLCRKDAAFVILDTHAGPGLYDLRSVPALKTAEFRAGIGRVAAASDPPAPLAPYLELLARLNPEGLGAGIRFYPGSPELARRMLRPQDRLVLNELHPQDREALRHLMMGDRRVRVLGEDGYALVKAQLPPPERRGLILIDPPFERPDDRERMIAALRQGLRRFATGIFLLWYPVKAADDGDRLFEMARAAVTARLLQAELLVRAPGDPALLNGAGLLIVNPPWQLASELSVLLPWLSETLRQGAGAGAKLRPTADK
ncbi:MAG: 23S rRNA (adenine(2030)-N(6))-methyltransferase RlmJ [Alphaproteobacteria bacterium]|nr:23S rRNA (adenine(2030)-N(6))-methyltransferase RlmJ [Alphaproteobacteria bacterium]